MRRVRKENTRPLKVRLVAFLWNLFGLCSRCHSIKRKFYWCFTPTCKHCHVREYPGKYGTSIHTDLYGRTHSVCDLCHPAYDFKNGQYDFEKRCRNLVTGEVEYTTRTGNHERRSVDTYCCRERGHSGPCCLCGRPSASFPESIRHPLLVSKRNREP